MSLSISIYLQARARAADRGAPQRDADAGGGRQPRLHRLDVQPGVARLRGLHRARELPLRVLQGRHLPRARRHRAPQTFALDSEVQSRDKDDAAVRPGHGLEKSISTL